MKKLRLWVYPSYVTRSARKPAGSPSELSNPRAHGKIIVLPVMNGQLLFEALKRIEGMCSLERFVALPMRAFNLAVAARCVGTNLLVLESVT